MIYIADCRTQSHTFRMITDNTDYGVSTAVSVFDILYTIEFELITLMNSKPAGKYFLIFNVKLQ